MRKVRQLRFLSIPAAVALAALAVPVMGQMSPDSTGGDNAMPTASTAEAPTAASSVDPQEFVKAAGSGGEFMVQLGQIAQQKAQSKEVKDFGKMMVQDHSAADQKLQQIARSKGYEVPSQLTSKQQKELDHLSSLEGKAFDQAYMKLMVKDHKHDVAAFKRAAKASGLDPALQNFATETLPKLEQHLDRAQQVESRVG